MIKKCTTRTAQFAIPEIIVEDSMVIWQNGNKTIGEVTKMAEEKKGNKPLETYRAGTVSLTVWKNVVQVQGKDREMLSFQLNKRYKDKDEWKDSKSLNIGDLPKVAALMNKAYYDVITKGKDEE